MNIALARPPVETCAQTLFRACVVPRLEEAFSRDVCAAWFTTLRLVSIDGSTARLSVRQPFTARWISTHYDAQLLRLVSEAFEPVSRVEVVATFSLPPAVPVQVQMIAKPVVETVAVAKPPFVELPGVEPLTGSPLDRRMTFETFLQGRSNQLAYSAAQRIGGANPGEPVIYNPLYIHASVGLGKTHLLQAMAHAATAAKRRVIYFTAEKFMYGFVSALKAQTAHAFKERLRAIDLLVIDDVQLLQGKSTQQEFCHTLNSLIDARKQIVIAADRPPTDLESLEERVRSRLAGGLCVEMGALDEALRIKILETRIAAGRVINPDFQVPPPVVAYVASVIQTNGRDLDGAVNRLMAHASLTQTALCVETAEVAIRDLVRTREPKRVKIEDIQKLVATHYNVSRADILSSRRTANVVRPRQIAMYLSKVLTLRSLPEIGRRFAGRDHTTVLSSVRKIERLCGSSPELASEIGHLRCMLEGGA